MSNPSLLLPPRPGRITRLRTAAGGPANTALAVGGMLLTVAAYQSVLPWIVAAIAFGLGALLLLLPGLGGTWERRMFTRVFLAGWVALGIASVYAEIWEDQYQLYSDAATFYDMAVGASGALTLEEIREVSEGSLAIAIWQNVYDAFAAMGFPKQRYIGLALNVLAVALACAAGARMARLIYGNDPARLQRLVTLASFCGLFWLFAGIHMRDSVVLLFVTLLAWSWIWFLQRPSIGGRLLSLVALNVMSGTILSFLRTEFFFVPLAMALAGITAALFGRDRRSAKVVGLALAVLGLAVLALTGAAPWEGLWETVTAGGEHYVELSSNEHGSGSLGMSLIVNQPMHIRLVLGTVYLFLFPIPVWSGFQLDSAYHLFKSLNALFFYALIPLLIMSVVALFRHAALRSPQQLFLLFTSLGFSMAVAMTSLESRHLGAFLVPVLLLALLPDLRDGQTRRQYRSLLLAVLAAVATIHAVWMALKL